MKGKTKMANWKARIYEHLENYKVNVLGIPGKGIEGDREYGHILPCGTHFMNYMGEAALAQSGKIKRHKGWYHLNSSQTMCINFFAPLVESKDRKLLNLLMSHIGINVEIDKTQFEYTPEKNGSSFDFYCRGKDGSQYYFEIKYTEDNISKKSSAEDRQKTFRQRYLPLIEKNPIFARDDIESCFMEKHYQAYRNMAMANEKDYSIFITMKENTGTEQELRDSLSDLQLKDGVDSHVLLLYWEDIIPDFISLLMQKDSRGRYAFPEAQGYYREFQRKYLPEK